jgi:hypothetical protein
MTNLRKTAIATLAAAVLSASALATPSVAEAGTKTDFAKAVVGGLVIGAIIGANANANPAPRIVEQPRRHRFGGNRFDQPRRHGRFGQQRVSNQFGGQDCFTREEVTIDRFGNRASSISTVCR